MNFFSETQPKKFFEPAKEDESEASKEPDIELCKVPRCDVCGLSDFWELHNDGLPRCTICDPPPSTALIGREYFFDDHTGDVYHVERDDSGEWWHRERQGGPKF